MANGRGERQSLDEKFDSVQEGMERFDFNVLSSCVYIYYPPSTLGRHDE